MSTYIRSNYTLFRLTALHTLHLSTRGRCSSAATCRGHAPPPLLLHSLYHASSMLLVPGSGSGNIGVFSQKFDKSDSPAAETHTAGKHDGESLNRLLKRG